MPGGPSGSTVTQLGSPSSEACGGSHFLPVSPVPKGLRVALLWKLQPFSALLPERSFQNHTATFRMESFLPPPAPLHSSGGCLLCSPPISVGSSPFWEQKLRTVPFALSRVASTPLSHTIRKATPPRGWRRLGEGKNHLLLAESSRKVISSSHQEKVQQVRKWGGPRRQG